MIVARQRTQGDVALTARLKVDTPGCSPSSGVACSHLTLAETRTFSCLTTASAKDTIVDAARSNVVTLVLEVRGSTSWPRA